MSDDGAGLIERIKKYKNLRGKNSVFGVLLPFKNGV